MEYVSGEILTKNGFQKRYIGFEKDRIIEVGRNSCSQKPIASGYIVPTFVNAHTHIGDSFIREKNIKLPKDIEKLVAPPDGLKHRLLKEVSDKDIIEGMKQSIDAMIKTGTSCFCDFREEGIYGLSILKTALQSFDVSSIILSRPDNSEYDKVEMDLLLKNSEGIGISAISDWDYSELIKIAKHVKKKKKIFALHASERIREDIDKILDLKPDFLVHMLCATESDFIRLKDNDIPVVICPRSNSFFGLEPNYELMNKAKIDFVVGTDNAMLNSSSILDELKFLKTQSKLFSVFDLLYKVTYGARKALNLECNILGQDFPADFVVLDKKSLSALYISK